MTVQTFRELLANQPFQPFRVVMSSGLAYEIRHPELAFVSKTSIDIAVDVEDHIPADYRMSSLLHITAVEPLNTPSGSKAPGTS